MNNQYSNYQQPLYVCNPKCFTCGKIISHIWLNYTEELKKITNNDIINMPSRTIDSQKLLNDSAKTEEGKILDRYGVIRYCCRRMILTEPKNDTPIV